MKDDEKWLLKELHKGQLNLRRIIENQDVYNHKRLWYIADKWADKGIVEYGVSLGTAWLTDKGIELAKSLE